MNMYMCMKINYINSLFIKLKVMASLYSHYFIVYAGLPRRTTRIFMLGQADGNNSALCPTLHNRKSQQGKCPYVITPTLPRHCGDNQKVISSTLPRLFHG